MLGLSCQASGIIIMTASGSVRSEPLASTSSVASKLPESDMWSPQMGLSW